MSGDSICTHEQPAPVDTTTADRAMSDWFAAAIECLRRAFATIADLFAPRPSAKAKGIRAMLERGRYRGTKKQAKAARRLGRALQGRS